MVLIHAHSLSPCDGRKGWGIEIVSNWPRLQGSGTARTWTQAAWLTFPAMLHAAREKQREGHAQGRPKKGDPRKESIHMDWDRSGCQTARSWRVRGTQAAQTVNRILGMQILRQTQQWLPQNIQVLIPKPVNTLLHAAKGTSQMRMRTPGRNHPGLSRRGTI